MEVQHGVQKSKEHLLPSENHALFSCVFFLQISKILVEFLRNNKYQRNGAKNSLQKSYYVI